MPPLTYHSWNLVGPFDPLFPFIPLSDTRRGHPTNHIPKISERLEGETTVCQSMDSYSLLLLLAIGVHDPISRCISVPGCLDRQYSDSVRGMWILNLTLRYEERQSRDSKILIFSQNFSLTAPQAVADRSPQCCGSEATQHCDFLTQIYF